MYVAAIIDQEKCIGCKTCVKVCPEPNAVVYVKPKEEKKGKCSVIIARCKGCGLCVANCPKKCIEMKLLVQEAA